MHSNSNLQKSSQLLVMTIQIDDKRSGKINVFDNDDPEILARDFCLQHNINQRIIPILIENIRNNIIVATQERETMNQYLSQKSSQVKEYSEQKESETQQFQQSKYSPFQRNTESHTVYDRLYQDAQKKKLKSQLVVEDSRTKNITRSSQESEINYGLMLYQRGMKKKEEMYLRAENAKKEKSLMEDTNHTHHPQINEISKQIARRSPEPIGEHLNKLARQMQEKKENAQSLKAEIEQQYCSFHPQINKVSQYIVEEKKKQSQIQLPHYESLYQDNEIQKAKIQQLDHAYFSKEHSFHPKIDDNSQKMVQGISFDERQAKFKSYQKERNSSVDESQLFKPRTGRAPQNRPQDLFQSLYNQAQIWDQNKKSRISKSQEKVQSQSRIRASQKSDILVAQQIQKSLSSIFEQLDSDQDGEIDALRIDVSSLDSKILEILKPLLLEMEEGKHILNQEEFIESATRLLQWLSNKEKHELLKRQTKKSAQSEFSFQVYICFILKAINQSEILEDCSFEKKLMMTDKKRFFHLYNYIHNSPHSSIIIGYLGLELGPTALDSILLIICIDN